MTKNNKTQNKPLISIIMGSKSDFETMSFACNTLDEFGVSYETLIISAHRTPDRMFKFAKDAEGRGIKIIIAGAGGAAHLPGMVASISNLPVLGVPVKSKALKGMDSLLSIVQMPAGIPVGTLAIGEAGAKNAALLALRILATQDKIIAKKLADFHKKQTASIGLKP
ncbi:MAG: 5-(carboxyamino)imidazole ribonucleotide mutase [Rickettsiales bacterium]|nr:5-(carboxyamino)imidazole ribonucleotide mutase [Rickettsiales bacterium]